MIDPDDESPEVGIYSRRTLWAFFWVCVLASGLLAWAFVPFWTPFQIVAAAFMGGILSFIMLFVNHLIIHPLDA